GGGMGLDSAQAGWAIVGRPLANDLAHARGSVRDLDLLPLGSTRRGEGRRAAGTPGDAAQQAADRRPDDVLLPVPRPGRLLLRRAALSVGLPGADRARDRRAAAAALDHAAGRGDRDPALVPAGVSAARRAVRPPRTARRNGR